MALASLSEPICFLFTLILINFSILSCFNSKHFNLIETLADNLIKKIETFDKVKNVKIKITKPDIFNDCSVSYEISNYP